MGSAKNKTSASKAKSQNARGAVAAKSTSKAGKPAEAKEKTKARALTKSAATVAKKSVAAKADPKTEKAKASEKAKAAVRAKEAAAKKAADAARVKAETAKRKRQEEAKKQKAAAPKAKPVETPVKAVSKPADALVGAPKAQKAPDAVANPAVAPKASKPATSPAPASPAQTPKATVTNERTDVTKKKTEQPAAAATVVVKAEPAPAAVKPAAKAVEAKAAAPKSSVHRTGFKATEFIVYPAHGVGQIVAIEEQEVAGFKLELFVISFAKDKMTLKVPLPKVLGGAIRKLSEPEAVKKSLDTLTGRARIKRTMWSRRAQEYEAKINSGDLGSIAEVVRDLYRSDAQPEQSYSERQLYEAALDRMGREIAAVQKLGEIEALKLIESHLQRGPKRGSKTDVIVETVIEIEGEVEQAA